MGRSVASVTNCTLALSTTLTMIMHGARPVVRFGRRSRTSPPGSAARKDQRRPVPKQLKPGDQPAIREDQDSVPGEKTGAPGPKKFASSLEPATASVAPPKANHPRRGPMPPGCFVLFVLWVRRICAMYASLIKNCSITKDKSPPGRQLRLNASCRRTGERAALL